MSATNHKTTTASATLRSSMTRPSPSTATQAATVTTTLSPAPIRGTRTHVSNR
jgi:hypothetical protein